MTDSARIVVVDNYDSFVYTIVGYLKTLGATVDVVRNDAIDPSDASVLDEYDGVLISPGPGAPADSGASEDVIRLCAKLGKPMFGVCLGLQALAEVFGCTVSHAPTIMHGKTSLVEHIDDEIFAGVANPMTATRYHSLAVEPDTVPDDLVVTAWTKDDHIVQGIKHRSLPMYAVQFHPESVMTQDGYRLGSPTGSPSAGRPTPWPSPSVCSPRSTADTHVCVAPRVTRMTTMMARGMRNATAIMCSGPMCVDRAAGPPVLPIDPPRLPVALTGRQAADRSHRNGNHGHSRRFSSHLSSCRRCRCCRDPRWWASWR